MYPSFIEISYRKNLLSLVGILTKDITLSTIDNQYFKSSYKSSIRQDDVISDIDRILENLKLKFLSNLTYIVSDLFKTVSSIDSFNIRSLINALKRLNLTPQILQSRAKATKDLMRIWVIENTRLIKSINANLLDSVASDIYQAVKNGESLTSLARDLQKTYNITASRAKLIAADQVAKLNGLLTKERKLSLGLINYVWATTKDERVRKSHKVLDGLVCSFEDDTKFKKSIEDKRWFKRNSIGGDSHHPGLAIRCRCTSYSIYT